MQPRRPNLRKHFFEQIIQAAKSQDREMIVALVTAGVSINTPNENDEPAILLLAKQKEELAVSFLLGMGANLHLAAQGYAFAGDWQGVKRCLKLGAHPQRVIFGLYQGGHSQEVISNIYVLLRELISSFEKYSDADFKKKFVRWELLAHAHRGDMVGVRSLFSCFFNEMKDYYHFVASGLSRHADIYLLEKWLDEAEERDFQEEDWSEESRQHYVDVLMRRLAITERHDDINTLLYRGASKAGALMGYAETGQWDKLEVCAEYQKLLAGDIQDEGLINALAKGFATAGEVEEVNKLLVHGANKESVIYLYAITGYWQFVEDLLEQYAADKDLFEKLLNKTIKAFLAGGHLLALNKLLLKHVIGASHKVEIDQAKIMMLLKQVGMESKLHLLTLYPAIGQITLEKMNMINSKRNIGLLDRLCLFMPYIKQMRVLLQNGFNYPQARLLVDDDFIKLCSGITKFTEFCEVTRNYSPYYLAPKDLEDVYYPVMLNVYRGLFGGIIKATKQHEDKLSAVQDAVTLQELAKVICTCNHAVGDFYQAMKKLFQVMGKDFPDQGLFIADNLPKQSGTVSFFRQQRVGEAISSASDQLMPKVKKK